MELSEKFSRKIFLGYDFSGFLSAVLQSQSLDRSVDDAAICVCGEKTMLLILKIHKVIIILLPHADRSINSRANDFP